MKLSVPCMRCHAESGGPIFEYYPLNYYNNTVINLTCSRGHESVVVLQSQKFEILLESAASALIDGYTLESAATLSSAYERFFEFSINVFVEKNKIDAQELAKTLKQATHQSERQLGAFLYLYLITFKKHYKINENIAAFRNKIIHKGYIPTDSEVISFGEKIYEEIFKVSKLLQSQYPQEVHQVIVKSMHMSTMDIPPQMHRTTLLTSGIFSLSSDINKSNFQDAYAAYKGFKSRGAI
ncbi:TPA: hypothetical protein U2R98_002975 [Yersinia enterocolitica]|nr:hypothetical protein [Yersinia enterocolitica]HEM8996444.1 hypothetical protein [Yersinia enterocolitica]HEO8480193.1 hypothetical protein [Yersinia enterocolitica]